MKKLTFLMVVLGLIFVSTGDAIALNEGKVTLFRDVNFEDSYNMYFNDPFSKDVFDDGWDNNIESIKVGKGFKVTLYEDAYQPTDGKKIVLYEGEYKDLTMYSEHRFWNDRASSLKVEKLSDPDLPLIKLIYGDNEGLTQKIGLDGADEFKGVNCLLLNDRVTSAEIPAEYKVTFYEHKEYGGHKNTEPVSGRTVDMKEFGMYSKVSSIKIEWNKYKLTKVKMEPLPNDPPPQPEDVKMTSMSATLECDNRNSTQPMSCEKTLESTYTATSTTKWENSTTVGITASRTVTASAGIEGVASGSVEASLAISVANEFTFGKEKSTSLEQKVSDRVNKSVASGCGSAFNLVVDPAAVNYNVTYIYSPVLDDAGTIDPKGITREIKGKMTINSASSSKAVAYDLPGTTCQTNQPAQPNPSEQGYMAQAWEWIKQRPCRLYEFFGGKDKSLMCGSANDSDTSINTTPNTNANTAVQPSNTSTNTK